VEFDETQSILLADHRTPLQSREELFAVGDEEDEDETAKPVPRPRDRQWSDDEAEDDDDPSPPLDDRQGRLGLLTNSEARQSWVNVGDIPGGMDDVDNPGPTAPQSELGAKAGIILVRVVHSHALSRLRSYSACPGHQQHVRCNTSIHGDRPGLDHLCRSRTRQVCDTPSEPSPRTQCGRDRCWKQRSRHPFPVSLPRNFALSIRG